jgi:hypothetical protein
LKAQAATLKETVGELVALVGGSTCTESAPVQVASAKRQTSVPMILSPIESLPASSRHNGSLSMPASRIDAEAEIPMEGDFKDF